MPSTPRISQDSEGRSLGVKRQEQDCRRLARDRGWSVAEVFTDNDLTAADPTVRRPAYERMLEGVAAGEFDAVLVYNQDRLVRQPIELERLFLTCQAAGMTRLVSVQGDVDLGSEDGQLLARVKGAIDFAEVAKIRRRVKRKMLERAEQGLPQSGYAGFGYEADKVTVIPAEAALVKDAVARVLAGESLASIAADWNDRKVTTRQGGRWRGADLGRMLKNPRLAALRVHQGRVVGPAAWPPIIDRAAHDRLVRVLNAPGRRHDQPMTQKLLTGLALCGNCGETLNRKYDRHHKAKYFCRHCYGCVVGAEELDGMVVEMVFTALDGDRLVAAVQREQEASGARDVLGEIEDCEERLVELATEWAEGRCSAAERRAARTVLDDRLKGLRATLARQQGESVLDGWAGKGGVLRSAWPDLPHSTQRTIISAVMQTITVGPGRRGVNAFDPSRVQIAWAA